MLNRKTKKYTKIQKYYGALLPVHYDCISFRKKLRNKFLSFAQLNKMKIIRLIAVRETGISRHHGGQIEGPPETPRTSQHYHIEGINDIEYHNFQLHSYRGNMLELEKNIHTLNWKNVNTIFIHTLNWKNISEEIRRAESKPPESLGVQRGAPPRRPSQPRPPHPQYTCSVLMIHAADTLEFTAKVFLNFILLE